MSAIEQEPQSVSGVAIATSETLLAAVYASGTSNDKTLSAISAPNNPANPVSPYKAVRVRGVAWVSATSAFLTVKLRQGIGTGGAQVGPSFTNTVSATAAAGVVLVPVPFEFVDTAPAGINYTLTGTGSAGCTCAAVFNVTGFTA